MAGECREGYSSTIPLASSVLLFSTFSPSLGLRLLVALWGFGALEVRTRAANHPRHFNYIVVSRFFLAKGESEME